MKREDFLRVITQAFRVNSVVALLGPRQCGKTTLAKQYAQMLKGEVTFFDLEDPLHLAQLDQAMLAIEPLSGLVVIDEIQRRPELFPILRVLVDQKKHRKFLILGSASRDLIQQSSETLAGRISYIELTPFHGGEVGDLARLWLRGGFPKSYLARNNEESFLWRKEYIKTFLERDIPALGFHVSAKNLHRFWMMLSHYHGQIFNASEIGKSLGVAHTSVRHYLDILSHTFMVRELQPWYENINKRQVKAPKIYFKDSGVLHALWDIETKKQLDFYPKLGSSWEGFALEEIIRAHGVRSEACYFWAIHAQAELDLLLFEKTKRIGFEIKYTGQPQITKSMMLAIENLNLSQLFVIYPGNRSFSLAKNIKAVGLMAYLQGKES